MTESKAIDLGRRAVACRGWRWLPGMLARAGRRKDDYRIVSVTDGWVVAVQGDEVVAQDARSLPLPPPDLRDPAPWAGFWRWCARRGAHRSPR